MSASTAASGGLFGRFLELAIATDDIVASVQFYERLGFRQFITGDAWPHRYGVLGDGRIHVGLHEYSMPSPALSFVRPELQHAQSALRAAQLPPEQLSLGHDRLHQLRLRDPGGHAVVLLEARTFSPGVLESAAESCCGYFLHLSLPEPDFASARAFWERAGFIALPEERIPYAHVPLTSDRLDLAFHRPRTFEKALLVFASGEVRAACSRLQDLGIAVSGERPHGVAAGESALIEAPEGTQLLLVQAHA